MKTEKELLVEIYDEVNKNHLSRQLELEHLKDYSIPQALKIKNKEEKNGAVGELNRRSEELEYEIKSRKVLLSTLKKKIK